MTKIKLIERGWGGHFICCSKCNFRRNTLVEYGNRKVVVSTVGDMRYDENTRRILKRTKNEPEEIGCDRHYETMAFVATKQGDYFDADVSQQVEVSDNWSLKITEDNIANDMHEENVRFIANKLSKGDKAL